jgi:hypothetical protein
VKDLTFAKLINECYKSLDALMAESQQTLTLLRMVKQYPEDSERKNALQLQWLRENRLRLGYEERRAELLRLISGQSQSDNAA